MPRLPQHRYDQHPDPLRIPSRMVSFSRTWLAPLTEGSWKKSVMCIGAPANRGLFVLSLRNRDSCVVFPVGACSDKAQDGEGAVVECDNPHLVNAPKFDLAEVGGVILESEGISL